MLPMTKSIKSAVTNKWLLVVQEYELENQKRSKNFKRLKCLVFHGINIKEVLTDNGSEFTAYTSQKAKDLHFFETMLKIVDIKHRYTRPYRPQTNGKIERFWKILNNKCIRLQTKSQICR